MTGLFFPSIGNVIIPSDELLFFRGVQTTNPIFTVHPQASENDRYTTLFQPPIVHFKNFLTQSGANDDSVKVIVMGCINYDIYDTYDIYDDGKPIGKVR